MHAHAHAVPAKKAKESDDESARKARKDAPREAKKKTEASEEKTEGWFNNDILLFGNFPYLPELLIIPLNVSVRKEYTVIRSLVLIRNKFDRILNCS